MLKDIESKIKGNKFVIKGMEIYENFYKSMYENLQTSNKGKEEEHNEIKESTSAASLKKGKSIKNIKNQKKMHRKKTKK